MNGIEWTASPIAGVHSNSRMSGEQLQRQRTPSLSVSHAPSGHESERRHRTHSNAESVSDDSTSPVRSSGIAADRSSRRRSTRQFKFPYLLSDSELMEFLVSPEDYAKSIAAHSRRTSATSLYPGHGYIDLSSWLESRREHQDTRAGEHCLAVLHDFSLKRQGRVRHLGVADLGEVIDPPKHLRPVQEAGRVFLVRGCPPANWITTIGGRFGIDPEFINRHLDFFATLASRSAFSLPPLPSSGSNIIRLCTSTIIFRDTSGTPIKKLDLQARRREEAAGMATYRRNFQTKCQSGDSVVREFSTMDEQYSVIEQYISICVQKDEEGWIAIVWLDVGRDLSQGPRGPWRIRRYGNSPNDNCHAFPVVQHHPKMTVRQGTIEAANASGTKHPMSSHKEDATIHQSAAILPFEFGKLVDSNVANHNPFYALHYVFHHAACAENQVLNLVEALLEQEMGVLANERHQSHSLENLQFFSIFLDRHKRHISDTLRAVRARGNSKWPAKNGHCETASSAAKNLEDDFEDLLLKARELRERCTEGMGVMMNRAVVAESRKAIDQAERLKRLTLLATFFIPLSFTTSLFGMNFEELGQGHLHVWLFAVVSAPVLVLSYCAYVWDEKFTRVYNARLLRISGRFAKKTLHFNQAV